MEKQNDSENNSQNNYNKQNYNKVSMYQSSDLNQLGNNNNYDLNRYNRNMKNKYSYNPITNEYSQVNVSNINIKNIKIKTPLIQSNPQSNIVQENSINNEQMTINALNKLKNIFYTKGSSFIFYFQRKLSLYDFNHSSMISLENFLYISSSFNFNMSLEELELIFNFFDKDKKGLINYNNFIQTIIGQITPVRDTIIKNIFEKFNKDNNGNVSLGELKVLFNANKHPDVINKKRTRGEIYGEFLDMIETYKEYLENMRGVYTSNLSLEDFVNFYQIIGVDIEDDKIFEFMINNCWSNQSLNGNESGNYNNKYKSGNMYGNGGNYNGSQDNLMARAGSQIINNIF
jgi:Ca2+-binding EF-hand superfamily protein